jgi:hypothetical protein
MVSLLKNKRFSIIHKELCEMGGSYYIGWGTLALINAGLAQGKNRTGLNWFLLSLFLGPLATFILLFVEKR